MSSINNDYNELMDLSNRTSGASRTDQSWASNEKREESSSATSLSFEDMLLLMVTQFQNQTIDNQADTNDMMNQLIQMTVMQAMTEMSSQMEELTTANVMSYAASLVGKEVTLGIYGENGEITEKVGVVEGTGTFNGSQVIFVDGESYFLSSIMGVGRLPPMDKPEKPGEGGDEGEGGEIEGDGEVEDGEIQEPGGTGGSDAENSGAAGGEVKPDPEA